MSKPTFAVTFESAEDAVRYLHRLYNESTQVFDAYYPDLAPIDRTEARNAAARLACRVIAKDNQPVSSKVIEPKPAGMTREDFLARASLALDSVIASKVTFTSDDVWNALGTESVKGVDGSLIGIVIQKAKRAGRIVGTGRYVKSEREVGHHQARQVWARYCGICDGPHTTATAVKVSA